MFYSTFTTFSSWNRKDVFSTLTTKFNKFAVKTLAAASFAIVLTLCSAANLSAATFTVTTTADNEANGCASGQCTLREAINSANFQSGADTINFAPGVIGTITLTGGQLTIFSNLTIDGPGAGNLTVSGNNASRVFLVATPVLGGNITANINNLTITGGNATPVLIGSTLIGDGGGILNGALLSVLSGTSTLNLNDSVVINNASTTLGGGVATRLGATTNINRSLITNNSANPVVALVDGTVGGGGIANTASTTTLINSTVTNNNSLALGGGILNTAGIVNSTNATVSHNTSTLAGGGVASLLGAVNLRNTIIAKNNDLLATNIAGRDVTGLVNAFNSLGGNLIGSNLGAEANFSASIFVGINPQPNAQLDLVGGIEIGNRIIDPRLGSLANNGGSTNTRALLSGSPAINGGQSCVINDSCISNPGGNNPPESLTTDQRGAGFPRLLQSAVDIGAFESELPPAPTVFTVNSMADDESDGCFVGHCTLREAIDDANALSGADTINFANGMTGTLTLTRGQLTITGDLTINGPGAGSFAISGNNASRVFVLATPFTGGDFTVNLNKMTIMGGNATPVLIGSTLIGDGGGILNGALLGVLSGTSTLNLNDSVVMNNASTTLGGGVATRLGATTIINRSLITNNSANPLIALLDGTVGGGGIANSVLSTTSVMNSTITNNNSLALGGGVLNAVGTVNLINNTISHNTSTLGGGGVVSVLGVLPPILGVTNIRNTIIAKNNDLLATNIAGRDIVGELGSFNSLGNNLIGSNFGAEAYFTASTFVGVTPQPNARLDLVGGIDVGNQIIDPLLGPLADNGGLTPTRALQSNSPALNKGNNCVTNSTCSGGNPPSPLLTDQRGAGFARLSGIAVDIGSYEAQFIPTAATITVSGRVLDARGKGIINATVKVSDGTGKTRTVSTNPFGNFRFDGIASGTTNLFQVTARGYQFAAQVVNLNEDTDSLNFIGN